MAFQSSLKGYLIVESVIVPLSSAGPCFVVPPVIGPFHGNGVGSGGMLILVMVTVPFGSPVKEYDPEIDGVTPGEVQKLPDAGFGNVMS